MFKSCFLIDQDPNIMIKCAKRLQNPQNNKNSEILNKLTQKRSLRSAKSLNSMKGSQQILFTPSQPYNQRIYYPQPKEIKKFSINRETHHARNINFKFSSPKKLLNFYRQVQFEFKPQKNQQRQKFSMKREQQDSTVISSIPSIKISQALVNNKIQTLKLSDIKLGSCKNLLSLSLIKQDQQNLLSPYLSQSNRGQINNHRMLLKSTVSMRSSSKSVKNSIVIERQNPTNKIIKLT